MHAPAPVLFAVVKHMTTLAERFQVDAPIVAGIVVEMSGGEDHLSGVQLRGGN